MNVITHAYRIKMIQIQILISTLKHSFVKTTTLLELFFWCIEIHLAPVQFNWKIELKYKSKSTINFNQTFYEIHNFSTSYVIKFYQNILKFLSLSKLNMAWYQNLGFQPTFLALAIREGDRVCPLSGSRFQNQNTNFSRIFL